MPQNKIDQVRPTATFENYIPKTPEQERALEQMKLATHIMICNQDRIANDEYPFANSSVQTLIGSVGSGKTHLIEAMINQLRQDAPGVANKIFLARGQYALQMPSMDRFQHKPIIIIDDAYSHRQSSQAISASEIEDLSRFLFDTYENRCLVLMTSNFSFLNDMQTKINRNDQIGRTKSRINELFTRGGELEVKGPDHRGTNPGQNPVLQGIKPMPIIEGLEMNTNGIFHQASELLDNPSTLAISMSQAEIKQSRNLQELLRNSAAAFQVGADYDSVASIFSAHAEALGIDDFTAAYNKIKLPRLQLAAEQATAPKPRLLLGLHSLI